jgi:tetratricopeptide (TPR) repeat protein
VICGTGVAGGELRYPGLRAMFACIARVALLLGLACGASFADPAFTLAQIASDASPAEPEGYRELVNAAVVEFRLRHFPEARGLFTKAHELSPSARTLRGLGATEFELRNYSESVRYLEASLSSAVKPLDVPLRERTARLLERARAFVGRLELNVQPPSSVAMVDGLPVRGAKELLLEVGDHVIEFYAPGYVSERRKLRVDGGECKTLHVALTLRIEERHVSNKREPRRALVKNPWLWTGIVILASGAALGVGLTLRPRPVHYDDGTAGVVAGK